LALLIIALHARSALAAPSLRVGSKAFAESVILGDVAGLLAAAAGAPVENRRALGGTRLCWDALVSGALDIYPEYTGTLREEILGGQTSDDLSGGLPGLQTTLAAQGLGFIGPLGFDNRYALAMREQTAARLGIRTISDLARHPELRIDLSNEFLRRRDGWPGLAARYGLPNEHVQGLDHELAIRGLVTGALDVTDIYSTDAEIARDGLRVLTDDRGFFPRYQAILLYRRDAEARWPAAFAALGKMSGQIDDATMMRLNARVKLDKVPERTVAADFVTERFGVRATHPEEARWPALWRRAREHLALVSVSLLAAMLCALPLGVLAARRPRLGEIVLAAVGVVQTIPSLALLVFMIPLLGIGAWPATAALFLYSLLPIVRNTYAGLTAIPGPLLESAEALGLPRRAILWRIELPLALGTILAGIQSAAVINIGTATLGALVGAGGFGQPIFAGIRLDDVSMILEGAIPASALALVVQGLFDLLERLLVPKGLRAVPR
jgi:osmoprotectant transport system permease protein